MIGKEVPAFRFWCCKVLPLVYDDSLSYYEVLCKVVEYINNLIKTDVDIIEDVDQLKSDLQEVQTWINNYDTTFAKEIIEKYLCSMIFVEISKSGYIVYNVPDTWDDIKFNTVGVDTDIPNVDYGTLVLSY